MSTTEQTDGELAFVLMDAEVLQSALKEIAHQARSMADEQQTAAVVLEGVIKKFIPAEHQENVLALLNRAGERETWLNDQTRLAARVVAGSMGLTRLFQQQRDQEVRARVAIEALYDRLVTKLENGDTDDPIIEQFLNLVGENWYDLEG